MRAFVLSLTMWTALIAALACTSPTVWRPGVLVPRPDTRHYDGIYVDSAVGRAMLRLFQSDTADEIGICIFGRDTLMGVERTLSFTRVERSLMSYHDSITVKYAGAPCGDDPSHDPLVAMAHYHLLHRGEPCTHSDEDAAFLFEHPKLAVLFLLCTDGRIELLWQDGRRWDTSIDAARSPF